MKAGGGTREMHEGWKQRLDGREGPEWDVVERGTTKNKQEGGWRVVVVLVVV